MVRGHIAGAPTPDIQTVKRARGVRRLQAYGRGRVAGGPTPDIWGARGWGPYNSAWGPHGQVGFVASRRVGTP
eukprot:gene21161-biopygen19168